MRLNFEKLSFSRLFTENPKALKIHQQITRQGGTQTSKINLVRKSNSI